MSPEAQRIAIAEARGFFRMGTLGNGMPWWGLATNTESPNAPNRFTFDGLPHYESDLNAMHEAEKTLLFSRRQKFYGQLRAVCSAGLSSDVLIAIQECISATAAQRAEAFLRAIGKWEDGK